MPVIARLPRPLLIVLLLLLGLLLLQPSSEPRYHFLIFLFLARAPPRSLELPIYLNLVGMGAGGFDV